MTQVTPLPGVAWTSRTEVDDMTARARVAGADLLAATGHPVGLWRASSVPVGWVPADGWVNEGSGGRALDLIAASEGAGNIDTSPTVTAGDANRVEPELVDGGFVIGHLEGDAVDGGDDFGFFCEAAFDLSGSFAWTLHFTPDDIGVASMRYLWQGGPNGHDGVIVEETDQATGGPFVMYVGDEATFHGTAPYAGFGADNGPAVAGEQAVTFVVDRDADELRCYRDGSALDVDLADISGMGDCTAAYPLIVGPGQTVHGIVFHAGQAAADLDVAYLHSVLRFV